MRFLILFSILISSASANEFLEFGDKDFAAKKTEESRWTLRTGFQYIRYPMSLPEFRGEHNNTLEGDLANAYGMALGVGREFYWGAGISSTFLISGSYFKSINKEVGKAAEDIDLDITNVRIDTQLHTYEASLSLNYLFDNKVVDVQPFIEAGAGAGFANYEKEYTRKALPTESNGSEDYNVRAEEQFVFSKVSLGLNIIAFDGLVSFFKLTSMSIVKTDLDLSGSIKPFGSATRSDVSSSNSELDQSETVYTAAIGMGYLF